MKDFIFLFSLLLLGVQNLQCGEEIIEHCLECGEGINMNFCQRCEDKYFLFLGNFSCLPCDDEVYGQIGCGGKCSLSNSDPLGVLCEKDGCKDGYYYLNNICQKCSDKDKKCGKCTYNPPSGYYPNDFLSDYFNCTECISDQYSMKFPGDCWPCLIFGCSQCHYENVINVIQGIILKIMNALIVSGKFNRKERFARFVQIIQMTSILIIVSVLFISLKEILKKNAFLALKLVIIADIILRIQD